LRGVSRRVVLTLGEPALKLLAISGSLRAASINTAFCHAAAQLAPEGVAVTVYDGLGRLPLFNPDLESLPPAEVLRLRAAVHEADAVLIASPEYAHGVSGVMKNALDWLVSFEGFVAKPVAVVNTSPRAHHAYDALLETLRTMSATLIPEGCVSMQLLAACTTQTQMIETPIPCVVLNRFAVQKQAPASGAFRLLHQSVAGAQSELLVRSERSGNRCV
jgi:chromate reductase